MPPHDFPFCGYTWGPCHTVGSWLASRPSLLCATDPSLGATAHTPGSPAGARVRFLPRKRWPSPLYDGLGAPKTTAGIEHSHNTGALGGPRLRRCSVRLMLRPRALLAPWTNRPRPESGRTAGTCTSGLSHEGVAPQARRISLPGHIGHLPGWDSHPLDRCGYRLHRGARGTFARDRPWPPGKAFVAVLGPCPARRSQP
jgi:hypothetical protein